MLGCAFQLEKISLQPRLELIKLKNLIFPVRTNVYMVIVHAVLFSCVMNSHSFEIKSTDINHSIFIGGTLQTDYRNISNPARADSRFDIRRARIHLKGNISTQLAYLMAFEFQGNETQHLVDAFADYHFNTFLSVRMGQFKVPFSHEWQINDSHFPFAERSIGYSLQPGRDIGLMIGGQFLNKTFSYGIGMFNGDGIDGSSRGNQKDDPEMAVRFLVCPFALTEIPVLSGLFSGISYTEGRIDLSNISVNAKSTGMIGTKRSLYVLNANTKFGALLDVDKRKRTAIEGGLRYGPVSCYGEYQRYQYMQLKPVRGTTGDANFYSWYVSFVINLYGHSIENNTQNQAIMQKSEKNTGLWQAAFRREYFSGDQQWIIDNAYNSTREANAYSIALSYFAGMHYRLLLDYSVTDISDPLRIRVNPDGTIEYMSSETAFTLRFQISI
jgi:phosphate-selective porin OprO/OprP